MKKFALGIGLGLIVLLNGCLPQNQQTRHHSIQPDNAELKQNALTFDAHTGLNAEIELVKRPRPKPTPTPKPLKTPEPKPQPKPSLKQI